MMVVCHNHNETFCMIWKVLEVPVEVEDATTATMMEQSIYVVKLVVMVFVSMSSNNVWVQ